MGTLDNAKFRTKLVREIRLSLSSPLCKGSKGGLVKDL